MDARDFYRLSAPTEWAGPPETYSYSSMKQMAVCLRQWQLGRSKYGDLPRYPEKPSEPAEVGIIVHEILSKLFRVMAIAGYPAIGSDAFRDAISKFDIPATARRMIVEIEERVAQNPRAAAFRFQSTARDVYNKVVEAFRKEYAAVAAHASALALGPMHEAKLGKELSRPLDLLDKQGFLSEHPVRHPSLPLHGIIDLLARRGKETTVLDFKTGAPNPRYREQLRLYALLWWRSTGDLPTCIEVRYGARVERWAVTEAELRDAEAEVEATVGRFQVGLSSRPAEASMGAHCSGCSVRQLCGSYWDRKKEAGEGRPGGGFDLEVVVQTVMNRGGFIGRDGEGNDVAVVCEDNVAASHGPFFVGERLRIVNAQREADGSAVQMTQRAEVFRVG